MLCTIWYHLYNFKNVKNTHGGVLLLVKLQALAATHQLLEDNFQAKKASSLQKSMQYHATKVRRMFTSNNACIVTSNNA